jgi:hypothetical protein
MVETLGSRIRRKSGTYTCTNEFEAVTRKTLQTLPARLKSLYNYFLGLSSVYS